MRRIKGIVLNNVGDDSRSLVRANRHYSFYIRSLLDDPTFDVLSITTTTTKKPPPQVENRNNQVSVRRINNRFIIYKGSGKVSVQKLVSFVWSIEDINSLSRTPFRKQKVYPVEASLNPIPVIRTNSKSP